MKFFYRLISGTAKGYFALFHRHKVYGSENIPKNCAIIAPNHTSYYDPPIIAASFPEEIVFLARASLFRFFGFSYLIRQLNAYPVAGSTTDLTSIKTILQLLSQKKKVVIFPEGVRSHDGRLAPIKSGIGMLALRSGCPIVPVYIYGSYDVWHRKRMFPKLWGKTACVIGKPICVEDFDLSDKKKAQEDIAKAVGDSLEDLRKWYENVSSQT